MRNRVCTSARTAQLCGEQRRGEKPLAQSSLLRVEVEEPQEKKGGRCIRVPLWTTPLIEVKPMNPAAVKLLWVQLLLSTCWVPSTEEHR